MTIDYWQITFEKFVTVHGSRTHREKRSALTTKNTKASRIASVPFVAQIELKYKHHPFKPKSLSDAICYDKIVLELKAVKQITDEHRDHKTYKRHEIKPKQTFRVLRVFRGPEIANP